MTSDAGVDKTFDRQRKRPMKIRVDLYGTLSLQVSRYRHSQGIEMELQEGATVNDLLALLKIDKSRKAVVAIDGRIC